MDVMLKLLVLKLDCDSVEQYITSEDVLGIYRQKFWLRDYVWQSVSVLIVGYCAESLSIESLVSHKMQ